MEPELAKIIMSSVVTLVIAITGGFWGYLRLAKKIEGEHVAKHDAVVIAKEQAEIDERARRDKQISDLIGVVNGIVAGLGSLTAELKVQNTLESDRIEMRERVATQQAASIRQAADGLHQNTEVLRGLQNKVDVMNEQITNDVPVIKKTVIDTLSPKIEHTETTIADRLDELQKLVMDFKRDFDEWKLTIEARLPKEITPLDRLLAEAEPVLDPGHTPPKGVPAVKSTVPPFSPPPGPDILDAGKTLEASAQ